MRMLELFQLCLVSVRGEWSVKGNLLVNEHVDQRVARSWRRPAGIEHPQARFRGSRDGDVHDVREVLGVSREEEAEFVSQSPDLEDTRIDYDSNNRAKGRRAPTVCKAGRGAVLVSGVRKGESLRLNLLALVLFLLTQLLLRPASLFPVPRRCNGHTLVRRHCIPLKDGDRTGYIQRRRGIKGRRRFVVCRSP
jgi:hypothetical protein